MARSKLLLWLTIALTALALALAVATAVLVGLFLTSGFLMSATLPLGIVTLITGLGAAVSILLLWREWR